ncbi:DUF3732 domain-containing protein [Acetivibrio straminisolvens]|jgi:hypothetical protein|uniref:DUF3732 domain-containing protein n=1 Tax=Acetivibrio straminisolvens TaxID=253314 RepID=UPI002240240A|nr:DUF3732 domain-containing protein [Acetivibrio straminisolvens]
MQILAIVLYGKNGKIRILPFQKGKVNIITGRSKTGKSVIGDIIDYCFGGSSCNIAEGFVREHVALYGLHLEHDGEFLFIARENPPAGQSSTNKCCYIVGTKEIPEDLSNATPIDNDGLEKFLSAKIGISENLFKPPSDQSRNPLSANIRHTLYYCIQNQDEIASQKMLFHRQSEPFMPQAIKDTLPYFLGIINENALILESERSQLTREYNIILRSINEVEMLKGNGLHRATELLAEAKEVGLLPSDIQVNLSDYNSVRQALNEACQWKSVDITIAGMDRISLLQSQLQLKEQEIDGLSIDIRNSEEFLGQVRGYSEEVEHQKSRLESIGLFEQVDFDPTHCPLCSETVTLPLPSGDDIRNAISRLSDKLTSVTRERPHLRKHIDGLTESRQRLREQSDAIQHEIHAIYEENKEALLLKDLNARRARVIGRISLWLESVVISDELDDKRAKLAEIQARIKEINTMLDADETEERKQSVINRISTMISDWAKDLGLEHSEYPYRLDINRLTVMVDRDRPVPLQQLGSGSNWLGCHLIALFALHTYFRNNNRPVPSFLFLDQPSQVYFPPETNDTNVDSQEIRAIYSFIFDRVKELHPNLQVIIVDHADINEKYFQEAVVEKWWDGAKLVPIDW